MEPSVFSVKDLDNFYSVLCAEVEDVRNVCRLTVDQVRIAVNVDFIVKYMISDCRIYISKEKKVTQLALDRNVDSLVKNLGSVDVETKQIIQTFYRYSHTYINERYTFMHKDSSHLKLFRSLLLSYAIQQAESVKLENRICPIATAL